jgi:hypothetical protein
MSILRRLEAMSVIAEFRIDASQFALGDVLQGGGNVEVEVERVVPATDGIMPYVWVIGTDTEAFERAVRQNPEIESLTRLDRVNERVLYRVVWHESVQSLVAGMVQTEATILEARGGREWQFRIRFADHEHLSTFSDYCVEHDIALELDRVYALEDLETGNHYGLTDEQREALLAAVLGGYFGVPRGTTLGDVAAELGISRQAASERIRRGAHVVLSKVLLEME